MNLYLLLSSSLFKSLRFYSRIKKPAMIIISVLCASPAVCQWVKGIGGVGQEFGQDVKIDAAGNVFVAGNFSGTADFDPGPGVFNLKSSCPCDKSDPSKSDIFVAKYDVNGSFLWAIALGGGESDHVEKMSLDAAGNVYITGQFAGIADFDPGTAVKTLKSTGSTDIFLAKYNTNGQLVWANNFGGILDDGGTGIAVDKSGSVFVTGSFLGAADFDPGAGIVSFNSNGTTDVFFAKYSPEGRLLWAKDIEGSGEQNGRKIELDGSGNIYITGTFFGTSDLDPAAGRSNLTGAGSQDTYFAKYTANGNLVWAKSIGAYFDEAGIGLAVDVSGNVFITGFFVGTTDFDPGPGTTTLSSAAGGLFDGFLLKLNTDGIFQWAFKVGSTGSDATQSVAVDAGGNIFICGSFQGAVDFDPGAGAYNMSAAGNELYFAKYSPSGKFLWAQSAGGPADELAYAIDLDAAGNVFVTGYFTGTTSFKTGAATATITTSGGADVFVLKFSLQTLEAEQAVLHGAVAVSNQPGFTGTGFADYQNASADLIEWTVNAPAGGSFFLQFRYANGAAANRPLKLEVNGIIIMADLAFSPTGGWSIWAVSGATVNLNQGSNTIRLTTTGFNGPNVDNLRFEKATCQSETLEAEQALLTGAIIADNQPGFTGSGFADYQHASGDFIEWTVNAATSGAVSLQFRYANGAAANRPLKLEVNGATIVAALPFSPTGNWTAWLVSSVKAAFTAGVNKIRLTTTGLNGPNIDQLAFGCDDALRSFAGLEQAIAFQQTPLSAEAHELKAYIAPNPVVGGTAKLVLTAAANVPMDLVLVDMLGRRHKSLRMVPAGTDIFTIPVNELPAGAYVIKITQGKLSTCVRLIISKR